MFQLIDGGLSQDEIIAEVERTRLQAIIEIDRRIAALKLKRECLASTVRNQMQNDGCVRHKVPGVGVATLKPRFGSGSPSQRRRARTLGPYLSVKPEGDDAA